MTKRIAEVASEPPDDPKSLVNRLVEALARLSSEIPGSDEAKTSSPEQRARALTLQASVKAASLSGTLALPPGPAGIITVLPDLVMIWRIQSQLVSDIAAAYGKTSHLGQSQMIYCLFRHVAGQAVRDVVARVGQRFLVKATSLRVMQRVLQRVGVSATQRATARAVSRWLPVIGAIGMGAYAFYDTRQVGKNAITLFSSDIRYDEL